MRKRHGQRQGQRGRAAAGARSARRANPEPKRTGWSALEQAARDTPRMVDLAGPLLVRIVRVSPRRLDDDNLSGGSKGLRDAIAQSLGRRGDSETDLLWWEYRQEKGGVGEYAVRIEIFRHEVTP